MTKWYVGSTIAVALSVTSWAIAAPVMPVTPDYAWAFDDTATTAVATASHGGVDGTMDGSALFTTNPGHLNFAYAGNGALNLSGVMTSNDQVILDDFGGSDKINLSGGNNAITVSAWVLDRGSTRGNIFGNWFTGLGQCTMLQVYTDATARFHVRQSGDDTLSLIAPRPGGQYVHVVGVFDGVATHAGTAGLYLDNSLDASSSAADVLENYADEGTYRIGGDSRGNNAAKGRNYMFFGFIDEVSVWRSALSADEIEWLSAHSFTEIPEPMTISLLVAGGLMLVRRRR